MLLGLGVFLTISCAKKEQEAQVSDVSFTPCQQTKSARTELTDKVDVKFTNEGVKITHYNFVVACDFTIVNVTHSLVNGVLRITQQGSPNQADCICYTDVSYTINGISQNEVNVIFINGEQVYCYNDKDDVVTVILNVGDITEIKVGETAKNSQFGLSLRVENLNESRCPTRVICVWPGRVWVDFVLSTKEGEYNFTLSKDGLGGPSCEGVVIKGLKYYLVDVSPYPGEEEEQDTKTVKILVTESNVTDCDQDVIVCPIEFENAPNHPLGFGDVRIYGNCLKMKIGASGCTRDNWVLKLIAVESDADVYPPEWILRVSLDHIGVCAAYFENERSFNIEDLQLPNTNKVRLNILPAHPNLPGGYSILYEY